MEWTRGLVLVLVGVRPFCLTEPRRSALSRGQAQGPHPSPHPPLVPTGRGHASLSIQVVKIQQNWSDCFRSLLHSVGNNHQDEVRSIPDSVIKIQQDEGERFPSFPFLVVKIHQKTTPAPLFLRSVNNFIRVKPDRESGKNPVVNHFLDSYNLSW